MEELIVLDMQMYTNTIVVFKQEARCHNVADLKVIMNLQLAIVDHPVLPNHQGFTFVYCLSRLTEIHLWENVITAITFTRLYTRLSRTNSWFALNISVTVFCSVKWE
jgi:hypothetical protein